MPDDRRSRPGRTGKPAGGRGGRPGAKPGRGRQGGPRRPGGRRDARVERHEPEPRTEAERRAAEVRAKRGPRRTPRTDEGERAKIEQRTTEQWIDEGSVRAEAAAATARASGGRSRRPAEIDPEVVAQIHDVLEPQRAARLSERLASAAAALDRERFEEARRMVIPLVRELPQVAAVHEVSGLANYRLGKWKQAAQSLELARQLHPDPSLLPVLADCYRAQRRWMDVDSVWRDVRTASPAHEVMAEARIVVAGSLADRGDVKAAIALLEPATKPPKRVREHHLRQWYVLGDLYDRAGDTVSAARWFREVAARDAAFADVRDRLRALGR
jgi:tetratricopeptide (TPR) repeat protein